MKRSEQEKEKALGKSDRIKNTDQQTRVTAENQGPKPAESYDVDDGNPVTEDMLRSRGEAEAKLNQ